MHIEVRHLTKTFGPLRANDQISLSFAAGQVHGVLGENGAGKSTLMKLLSGFLHRDAGEILLNGHAVTIAGPADALQAGVGMVHQDPLDVPAFTALENFFCAGSRTKLPSLKDARAILTRLSRRLGFTVPPDQQVGKLTVGQRQQLEIMRLLACGAGVFILDEPTTGITAAQARALFAALKQLASEGKTILFVSHKLNEVTELCDTVSVLRSGQVVGPQMAMPVSKDRMLELMFGVTNLPLPHPSPTGGEEHIESFTEPSPLARSGSGAAGQREASRSVWSLDQITMRDGTIELRDLNLAFQPGIVTGLAGLDGSGQQQLLRMLSGRLRPSSGRIVVDERDLTGGSSALFLRAGVHYLPADRLTDGVIGALSLTDHFVLQNGQGVLVDIAAARSEARQAIERYAIKATPNSPIVSLSGGNQQRAMLALLPDQCVGVLIEQPTRGLDVASARSIWERLLARCAAGTALIFASADLDELLAYSDQVLVFFGGRVSRPIPRSELSEARLAELIGGVGFEAML